MYARVLKVTLANGKTRADAEAMADQTYPIYKSLKGFAGATFMVHDESKGEYGSVTLWETKEDAEAAAERVRANFMEHHADKVASPPEAHTAEVYEPK
jgi:heme-degrading monooxygenase HmoA